MLFVLFAALLSTPCTLAVSPPFDPLQHSGPASPYFDAPSQNGIPVATPSGCTVDQAAYILRHGARFPEPGSFAGWQALFTKFQNTTYTARGPLAFIPSWVPPVDDIPHEPLFLTSTGSGEAFGLGVELRKRYRMTKGGDNFTVWSASQQRVLDTASYFLRGYLSQGNYLTVPESNRGILIALPDSVNNTFANSLTPSTSCPLYNANGDMGASTSNAFRATYQGKIAARLNKFLKGLVLTTSDVGIMQDLCGFSDEIDGDTRFCDVFEPSEWLDYEYAHDLNYYYGSGPGNPLSATVGFPWVKAITDLFALGPNIAPKSATLTPPSLIMGFTHDNNLPPVISALGVWNTSSIRGVYPLSLTTPNPARNFRASYSVAFRGYVALERLTCVPNSSPDEVSHVGKSFGPSSSINSTTSDSHQKPETFVRIRIDNAPVPIPGCTSGPGSTCPLADFVEHINKQQKIAGDFVQRCGVQNVVNATSVVSFLTTSPDPESVSLTSL